MTRSRAYHREPRLVELDATVLRVGTDGARPYAILDDSILYPEGGGQPADHGFLNELAVLDVQPRGGEERHYLAAPIAPGPVRIRLDWGRRFDHMQQHTAQHLLTAVAHERFGWETRAFHLGELVSDVELNVPRLGTDDLDRLEDATAAEIRAARPVTSRLVTREEFLGLAVRTRGLPEGHVGDIRLIKIAGVDLNTCGGTHVASTAEIEGLKLLGTEPLRGGTRLSFVAGARLRRRLGDHERRNARLRSLFGTPDEDLVATAEAKLERVRDSEKRAAVGEEELAAALAESFATQSGPLCEGHYHGKAAAFLQRLARATVAAAPAKAVFLTATLGDQSFFVVAAGESVDVEIAALGHAIATRLGGRGGGAGRLFQGRAPSLDARSEALTAFRQAVPGG